MSIFVKAWFHFVHKVLRCSRLYRRDNNPKNTLFFAQQYVCLYARKVEVLGLSLNKLEEAKKKEHTPMLKISENLFANLKMNIM